MAEASAEAFRIVGQQADAASEAPKSTIVSGRTESRTQWVAHKPIKPRSQGLNISNRSKRLVGDAAAEEGVKGAKRGGGWDGAMLEKGNPNRRVERHLGKRGRQRTRRGGTGEREEGNAKRKRKCVVVRRREAGLI